MTNFNLTILNLTKLFCSPHMFLWMTSYWFHSGLAKSHFTTVLIYQVFTHCPCILAASAMTHTEAASKKSTSTAHLPHWEIGMQEARMMSMLVCEGAQQTSTSKVSQEIYKLRVTAKFSSACLLEFCD